MLGVSQVTGNIAESVGKGNVDVKSSIKTSFTVPFYENWEDSTTWKNWTVVDNNADTRTWWRLTYEGSFSSSCAQYVFGSDTADDWLISPAITLEANKAYRLSFWHNILYNTQKLKVTYGTSTNPDDQTSVIVNMPSVDTRDTVSVIFTVPANGDYYVGFYCYSEPYPYAYLYLDDIKVEEYASLGIPAKVGNATPIPGTDGAVSMGLTWTNPSKTYGGSDLTELTAINIYKDGSKTPIVYTSTLGIGADASWTDPNPTEGSHTYILTAVNSLGESFADTVNTFVGVDLPQGPQNLTLAESSGSAKLTWSAPPALGVKGGWFDASNITYRIVRNPGNVVLETSYSGGSPYVDNTTSSMSMYSYELTSKNDDGIGGSSTSNVLKIGTSIYLPYTETWEDSSDVNLWTIVNPTNDEAVWKYGLIRGNNLPSCIYFYTFNGNYSPDDDWLISPKMRFESGKTYRLTFYAKTHLYSYESIQVTLGKDNTVAAQTTTLYSLSDYTTAFEYDKNVVTFTVPATSSYCIGFTSSTATNNIYLDDITVEEYQAVDIKAVSVTGNTAPTVNDETSHTATVLNNGTDAISEYTVDLLDVDDNVLATKTVSRSLAAGKTASVVLTWTPTVVGNYPIRARVSCTDDGTTGNNTTDPYIINVQSANMDVITIGQESTISNTLPFYMYSQLFSESVYLAGDFGNFAGNINAIAYKAQITHENVRDQRVKIWMGETDKTSLNGGWIPATDLSLVFDSLISFPLGTYDLKIPLNTTFKYTGGNLVILIQGLDQREVIDGVTFFQSSYVTAASRVNESYYILDANNPDNTVGLFYAKIPNTMFFVNTGDMGTISGYVYEDDGTTPIAGAKVSIDGMVATKTTDANGYYEFPYVFSGDYTITAALKGYADGVKTGTLTAGQSASVNFSLSKLGKYNITGTVVGSNDLKVGVEGATVALSLYDDLSTTTKADGSFAFDNVYGDNKDYKITITAPGYSNYVDTITLGSANLSLDTLVIDEIANQPSQVVAVDRKSDALVTWAKPVNPMWIMKDNGDNFGVFGSNTGDAYSVAHRYTPEDFVALGITKGMYVTKVKIYVEAVATYTLKIWMGETGSESEIYSEQITPTLGEWYEHTLATPVPIDVSQNIVIGYEITQNSGIQPVGFDEGPAVENGDVVKDGTTWTTAHDLVSEMNYNWNIHAYCATSSNETIFELQSAAAKEANTSKKTSTEKVSNTASSYSFKLNTVKNSSAANSNSGVKNLPNGYKVWRLLKGDEHDESKWELLTTTAITDTFFVDNSWEPLYDTTYRFAIRSQYANGVSSEATFSNIVDKGKYAVVTATVTTNAESSEGAEVTLYNSYNEYSGTVDATGNVSISNVYFGTYSITIQKSGYREFNQEGIVIDENAEDIGTFTIEEDTRPPRSAVAVNYIANSEVSWHSPTSSFPQWIYKDDGINNGGLGYNDGGSMIVAQRFTPEELDSLGVKGYSITKIKMFPAANATYKLIVWAGKVGTETEIYEETITPTAGQWYEHILTTPVPIDVTQSYLIGYEADHESGTYPCGYDDGPHVEGGDLVYYDGAWYSLYGLSGESFDVNWNIHAYCSSSSKSAKFVPMTKQSTFKQNSGTFGSSAIHSGIKTFSVVNVSSNDTKVAITYKLWRLIEADKDNVASWTSLTSTPISDSVYVDNDWSSLADTNYVYAISAKYTNENYSDTVFTNTLEKGKVSSVTFNVSTNNSLTAQGATVTLTANDGNTSHIYSDTLNSDGNLTLYEVYKGDYTVQINKEGYVELEDTTVTVAKDYETLVYQLVEETGDPIGVKAEDNTSNSLITWYAPGSYVPAANWIYWDTNEPYSGIGTNDEFIVDVAQRFTSEDLINLRVKGLSVTKVSLYFTNSEEYPSTASFTLKVWKGSDSPELVYSQVINDFQWNQWNDIALTTPVPINDGDELWVGYHCDATAGYPAGIDGGPQVAGKGNMICIDGEWYELTVLQSTLTYNWLIHTYCDEVDGTESQPVELTKSAESTRSAVNVNKLAFAPTTGVKHAEVANHVKAQSLANSVKSNLGYKVWRFPVADESDEGKWTLLTENSISDTSYVDNDWPTLTNGDYKYAVKAVYVSGLSNAVLSNSLTQNSNGIDDRELDGVKIYPNPSNGNFEIYVKEPAEATITDITGKVVFEKQLNSTTNSISLNVNAGVYVVKLSTQSKTSYYKIVVR